MSANPQKMKHLSLFSIFYSRKFKIISLLFVGMAFNFCKEDPQLWEPKSQEQLIIEYIDSKPELYSEFGKLVELTGMEALLHIRGPFTLFLPTNEAMLAYYHEKGVNSLMDFTDDFRVSLIRNHLLANDIQTGDFGVGALRDTNAIGDYLVTEFQGSDIILDKYSKITDRDIKTANGYIHIIDKVLDPLTKDIYTVVSENPSYSIFSEGLRLTGLKDTLQIISFPYGTRTARTRFTVLAVPDTTYERYGINNAGDLVAWCGANPDSLNYLNNPFYRYMEYHCLNGSYYLSDLNTGLYPVLSRDNNMSVTIEDDYKINKDRISGKYTGFIVPASNIPAKNGALHTINDILPVTEPEPSIIIFETTDFFDMKQGDYFGKYYKRWFDGENSFAKIHWNGDFLQYYYKQTQPENIAYDCLSMMGWWSISVTFPKVMKGKYTVSIFQPGWNDVTNCVAYVDGELTPYVYRGPYGGSGGPGGLQKIADVNFLTTSEHTLTLKNITFGSLYWDYIRFDPVK
jgi:uncharacterized surface protein with fasciclin (FAS1) repeats